MAYVDYETEQETRKLIVAWFGTQANNWHITEQTVIEVAKILEASGECSSIFKYVPKPSGAFSGVGILMSEAFNYAKDSVKKAASDKQLYYSTCVKFKANERQEAIFMSQ